MFLNNTFLGSPNSFSNIPIQLKGINKITIKNCVLNNFYVSKNSDVNVDTDTYEWNFDTVLNCDFNNNLNAGNFSISTSDLKGVKIKRRPINSMNWTDLFYIDIINSNDLNIEKYDTYCGHGEYEYAFVPILINGDEGEYICKTIDNKFNGMYLVDKENILGAKYNITHGDVSNVSPKSIVQPIGSKSPYVISNGNIKYFQGSESAVFVDSNYKLGATDSGIYVHHLLELLNNNKAKILKFDDGRTLLIMIVDDPKAQWENSYSLPVINFNWIQVGDENSLDDLYKNGLVDILHNENGSVAK